MVSFSNIESFQNYFRKNDSLQIQPRQSLCIRDVHDLTDIQKSEIECDEPEVEKKVYPFWFLNKCIMPLGKVLSMQAPEQTFDCKVSVEYALYSPSGVTIVAKKAAHLFVRLSELFQLMVRTNVMSLKLESDQEFSMIGFKEEISSQQSVQDNLKNIFSANAIPGFRLSLDLGGHLSVSYGKSYFGSDALQNSMAISKHNGLTFSFSESDRYAYGVYSFIDRLLIRPELELPAGQDLTVEGDFSEIWAAYNSEFKDQANLNPLAFALDQLFLPFGKNVQVPGGFSYSYTNHLITISSDQKLNLKLIEGVRCLFTCLIWGGVYLKISVQRY